MKTRAYVAGVGMTGFGRHLDRGMKSIGAECIEAAISDAGISKEDIEVAYMSNAAAGVITGQECIRGEVILRGVGIGRIPVINVENACASGSTALHEAAAMITAGLYDVALVAGVEKLYHEDKSRSMAAFKGAVDVEILDKILAGLQERAAKSGATAASKGAGQKRSMFMDIYANAARVHMEAYGTTQEHFAMVSAKNSYNGSLNDRAQFREALSVEDVLAAPMIAEPLTRPMCSPIGDGGAALILVSDRKAKKLGLKKPVKVESCVLRTGWDGAIESAASAGELCAKEAYELAGVGPQDLDVVELHDASSPAEIMAYETLGLCKKGEGGKLIQDGVTNLDGALPVSTSGGLLRKGHPIGATGVAQIVELSEQLTGRSGKRQVKGAKTALAHNGGGTIGTDVAAQVVTVLTR
jgi:acetyl-CoA acetyltransferase